MPGPVNIDETTFDAEVANEQGLVVVDFWAPWCGPCRMIAPALEELASEYEGKVKITKVNVDENQTLAGKHQIRSIPTIMFFKGGQVVDTVMGAVPKQQLAEKIDQHV